MQETLNSLTNEFLTDLARRGYSFNTIKSYRFAIKALEGIDVASASSSDLMRALSQDRDSSTVAARQAAIKSFFRWLYNNGKIAVNPAEGLGTVRQKDALPRPIPKSDLSRIMNEAKKMPLSPRVFIFLLYDLGLRASEALSLDVDDISWAKGQEVVLVRNGKGNKQRIAPLSWEMPCINILKRLCLERKNGPLFITARKERATYDWAYYWWSKIMQQLNIEYTLHQLRHTAISKWINSGMNVMAVKRLAGHTLIQTTERYTRINDEDLRRELVKAYTT